MNRQTNATPNAGAFVEPPAAMAKAWPVRTPTEALRKRVLNRVETLQDNINWIRGYAMSMVSDWYDFFAFARMHATYESMSIAGSISDLEMRSALVSTSDEALFKMLAEKDRRLNLKVKPILGDKFTFANSTQEELRFWDRCAQIYAEEMQEVERLAAEARERAAQRIDAEFHGGMGIPEALRENNPQEYASEFEWN